MAKKKDTKSIINKTFEKISKGQEKAYEEFKKQADLFNKNVSTPGMRNFSVYPPQFRAGGHHGYRTAPQFHRPMQRSFQQQESLTQKSLTGQISTMARLGIDLINLGLAGGVKILQEISGQNTCGCNDDANGGCCDSGHSGHHGHDNCCDSDNHCSCDSDCDCCCDSDDYTCCRPSVNGCC